jgi:uracil-DNA glycosylase family 4
MKRIEAYGPESARIMIVGEAPGATEEIEGRPFVGPAGKMLRSFLNRAGIDPDDVYLTNMCKYRPPGNKIEKFFLRGGLPNMQVLEGMEELQADIKRIKPNVIVACGNFPLWALTGIGTWNENPTETRARGYSGITKWRGSILEGVLVPGTKVIPTFHPSYINQEGYGDHGTWACDLDRIARESLFPEIRRPVKNPRIDPNGAARNDFRNEVLSAAADPSRILTFDIEYIGEKLLCVGMSLDRDNPVVIPTRNPGDIHYCRDLLLSGIGLNAQNSAFDCSILEWWYQMPVFKYLRYDTMLAAHAANIELPKSFEYLCSIYTDQPYYKDMVDWNLIKKGKQSLNTLYEYNAIDTWTQHHIMEEQIKEDLTEESVRLAFEFEMGLLRPLWEMSKRGVRVDIPAVKALEIQLNNEITAYGMVLNAIAGRQINVMSGPHLAWLLFDQLGLSPIKMNKTGPATDDKTLAELLTKASPDAAEVITLVRDIKNRRSLVSKFIGIELDDDGRLRGQYNPAGTDTGRLASKKFYPTGRGANQQNQPRDKRVRSVFLPDEGFEFGYADLERAESLVVAKITSDPEMLRVHQPGIDAHKELAAQLFSCRVEDVTDDQRYLGKKTRHAGNYMQGPLRFMKEINKDAAKTGVSIDFAEAKHYINTYRSINEYLQPWWRETEITLYQTSTLYNLLGRKRVFYSCRRTGYNSVSELPNAVAFVPQSTVGDALNVGLLQLSGVECHYGRKRGIVARIAQHVPALVAGGFQTLMQIHDAVAFQYRPEHKDSVLTAVRELMRVPLVVPSTGEVFEIPVEIQVGKSWGEVKLWHEARSIAA